MTRRRLFHRLKGCPAPSAGFSVVETLIAGGLLLIIALGIIPLFTRAMMDNTLGNDATQASNYGKIRLEEFYQLPISHQRLAVAPGSTTIEVVDSWTVGSAQEIGDANEGWWPGRPTDRGQRAWTRIATVRVYPIQALDDGRLETSEAVDPSTLGGAAHGHFSEVEVTMESPWEVVDPTLPPIFFGGKRNLTMRVAKAL